MVQAGGVDAWLREECLIEKGEEREKSFSELKLFSYVNGAGTAGGGGARGFRGNGSGGWS